MALPSKTNVLTALPAVPQTWSELSWPQLCGCWQAKMRYGGNADVARAAALLAVITADQGGYTVSRGDTDPRTGEQQYVLSTPLPQQGGAGGWVFTARELAHLARETMPWFDFPYGDQGDKEERDEQGKVIRERREGHPGYVHPNKQDWRDAMVLQEETVEVAGVTFALPQGACSNITWHQYRSLQAIAPQLWQDGLTNDEARSLHAQFLAYILVPASPKADTGDRFHTKPSFRYDAERAEASVAFWEKTLSQPLPVMERSDYHKTWFGRWSRRKDDLPYPQQDILLPALQGRGRGEGLSVDGLTLFHICFQVWQTAVANFYPSVYPLLFGGGKSDPLHTALTGETDTINAVMKYQGYSSPEQVYNTELPIILGTLNTMSKEAKEIEKIKRKG